MGAVSEIGGVACVAILHNPTRRERRAAGQAYGENGDKNQAAGDNPIKRLHLKDCLTDQEK